MTPAMTAMLQALPGSSREVLAEPLWKVAERAGLDVVAAHEAMGDLMLAGLAETFGPCRSASYARTPLGDRAARGRGV